LKNLNKMKYIKLFEAFDLPEKINFKSIKSVDNIEYDFNIDNYEFRVSFKLDDDDITWERSYKVINYGEGYQTFDSKDNMAKKIVSAVNYITNDFINQNKPDIVYINHILMEYKDENGKLLKKEVMSSNNLNKRARINYQYLKNLDCIKNDKYGLKYFNFINSTEGYTACYIYNKELENKLNNLFSNLNEIYP